MSQQQGDEGDVELGGVKSNSYNKIGVQVQGEVTYDNKSMDGFELKANGHKASTPM